VEAVDPGRLPLHGAAMSAMLSLERFKKYCSHRFAAGRIRPVCGPVAGLPKRCFSHQEDGPQGRGYSGYGFI